MRKTWVQSLDWEDSLWGGHGSPAKTLPERALGRGPWGLELPEALTEGRTQLCAGEIQPLLGLQDRGDLLTRELVSWPTGMQALVSAHRLSPSLCVMVFRTFCFGSSQIRHLIYNIRSPL